jgi:gliding motility-associated-like protein
MKKNQITTNLPLFIIYLCFSLFGTAQHWSTTNVAGDGTTDTFIEGADALETPIGTPAAMAFDSFGNIYYINVGYNNLSTSGIYKIRASDNTVVHIEDELPGIAGIAIDHQNNIYFTRGEPGADTGQPSTVKKFIYKRSAVDGEIPEGPGVIEAIAGLATGTGAPPVAWAEALGNHVGGAGPLKVDKNGEYLYYAAPYKGIDGSPEANYIQRIRLSDMMTERVVGLSAGDGITNFTSGETEPLSCDLAMGWAMDWDITGNFYFAAYDHRIIKLKDGKLFHVAGTGEDDFSGDGGPATEAALNLSFSGLAITEANEIMISDSENHRIRMINLQESDVPAGTIRTICGTGEDESLGSPGNLANGIFKEAIEVNIEPYDIHIYDFEIYFTDQNKRIRRSFICKNPSITSVFPDKSVICKGDVITLGLDADYGDATIWGWYKDECRYPETPDTYAGTFTDTVMGDTKYYVIGTGGCTNVTECFEYVLTIDCKEFYNSITPNGDGLNDFVSMPVVANFPINTVTFYNRWGDILEVIENYDNISTVWRGTNGEDDPVDSGTYYFTAEAGGELISSGWIQVIREQ